MVGHQNYLKIGLITLVLLGISQVGSHIFDNEKTLLHAENTNAQSYQSAQSSNYLSVGNAISTRIGIAYSQNASGVSSSDFYKEIASIGETPEEKRVLRSQLITQNTLIIGEYLNLSRSDITALLDSSPDRESTLESFISQLELRFKNSAISLQSLEKQKSLLLQELESVESSIETIKGQLENNFSAGNTSSTLENVDEYFALRARYTSAFTDIVFINQFIKQHAFLNDYNKGILDTLINNKRAIINQSYVVIPDSGDEHLRPLKLIFDEAEIKNQ